MKIYFSLFLLLFLSCQNDSKQRKKNILPSKKQDSSVGFSKKNYIKSDEKFLDSIYNCENSNFTSVLEEIPNRSSNAYKITITSKKGEKKITKILDTRPTMSQINYCNDLYTVVGFPCGGPCYSQVFIFTDKNRPVEQYDYAQEVKNNQNIIAHIKNEEFEKLIIHNFLNSKELIVDIPDSNFWNYGQMDSMLVRKDNLVLYYVSVKKKNKTKTINLKTIL
ncbi:MAG: hypothetical protein PSV16_07665 [Flavobacterium sp.]|nr:hypothetical protein [Flavobacterium sp.]